MKQCPFCGSNDIKYSVSHVRVKMTREAGGGIFIRYNHFYSCSCGANMKGSDQFKAMEKWNTRHEECTANTAEKTGTSPTNSTTPASKQASAD